MKIILKASTLVCLMLPLVVFAQANIVKALQGPAWLIRDGHVRSLAPGTEIIAGDRIRTGVTGRVLMRMGEGSDVKLGALTNWTLDKQSASEGKKIFNAVMSIAKGAFRFTTTAFSKSHKRNISTRLKNVTIGIRGTDVWGRASDDKAFVVLIEGDIEIKRGNEVTQLTEPLSLYNAPAGMPADPLSTVAIEDLQVYAAETDVLAERGARSEFGPWQLNIASYLEERYSRTLQSKLSEHGYASSVVNVVVNGREFHRVVMQGYDSRSDAEFVSDLMTERFSLTPWVTRTKTE